MHNITTAERKDLPVEEVEEVFVFIRHLPATAEKDFSQVDIVLALYRTHVVSVFIVEPIESLCTSANDHT